MNSKKKNEISTKTFFIKYGICTGFFAVLVFIVLYSSIITRNSWKNNLRLCVDSCLEEKFPGVWACGSFVEIENPFSTSAACYEVRKLESSEISSACVARVTTYFGPVNSVFLCTTDGDVSFVGISSVHGRIKNQIENSLDSKKLEYFAERIPQIIGLEGRTGNE